MELTVTTPRTVQPVTQNEAKMQCRIERSEYFENDFIDDLIVMATDRVEYLADRTFINTVYRLTLPAFPPRAEPIYLPRCPLVSVDAVTYIPDDVTSTTYTTFKTDLSTSTLWPDDGLAWPDTTTRSDAVLIAFTSGYGTTAADVPRIAKQAILLLIHEWYHNRGDTSPAQRYQTTNTVMDLCEQLRPGDEFTTIGP